ncbi:MAG: hypothetical protein EHM28_13820 [Spirochaetaceae bacterium]|nr:MAG: hypothetical protein EHM28_13820 [Spirochaetaceae bacterium]
MQLQPGLREFYALFDYTESGLGTRADLEKVMFAYKDRLSFRFAAKVPVEAFFPAGNREKQRESWLSAS